MTKNSFFSSERLFYRGINETDKERLVIWRSEPKIIQFFRRPKPITKEEHEFWFKNIYSGDMSRFDFIIFEKTLDKAIGTIGVNLINREKHSCEISYMIAEPDCQRKGYAVESIAAMMKTMLREDITCFFAEVHRENIASQRTVEKLEYVPYSERPPFIIYIKRETRDAAHSC